MGFELDIFPAGITTEKVVLDTNVELKKPYHDVKLETTPSGIGVAVLDLRKDDNNETILMPLSFDSRLINANSQSSVEIPRIQYIAEAKQCRVIAVEQPGIGASEAAYKSNLDKAISIFDRYNSDAKKMLDAAESVVGFSKGERINILGYGQGAAIAAAMVRELSRSKSNYGLRLDDITFVEPINDQWRSLPSLLGDINVEANSGKHHFDWIDGPIDLETEKKISELRKKQEITTNLSGLALMRSFCPNLVSGIREDIRYNTSQALRARYQFVKFNESEISNKNKAIYRTATEILNASPLANVALFNVSANSMPLRMEAFQDMRVVNGLYKKGGPLNK